MRGDYDGFGGDAADGYFQAKRESAQKEEIQQLKGEVSIVSNKIERVRKILLDAKRANQSLDQVLITKCLYIFSGKDVGEKPTHDPIS